MALTVAELNTRLTADTSDLKSGLEKAEKLQGSFTDKVHAFGEKAQQVGKKMTIGLTLPIAALGAKATSAASDLNESMSKVGVVFGENAKDIEQWSKKAAKSMGISQQAALESAGTFGNLFRAMGLAAPATKEMSKEVVGLASDLASFNNLPTAEVLEKLRAGLVGESEPLRTLGVNINEATVKAKAMELGLVGANGELTEASKVQARYALILEQTQTAQGDFARTADGLANSTKIAGAKAEDAAASFGTALQPIMIRVSEIVSVVADKFSNLSPGMQNVVLITAALVAGIGPLVAVIGALSTAMAFLAANPIVLVIAGIAALAAGLVIAYQKSETFRNIVNAAFNAVRVVAESVFNWIKDHWGLLLTIIAGPVGLGVALVIKHFDAVKASVQSVWDFVRPIFEAMGNAIKKVSGPLGSVLGVVGKAGGAVGGILGALPKFHDGGVVPGPRGSEVPIMAQAGERVVPNGGGGGGGYSGPQVVQLVADGKVIQEILLAHQRRSGGLGFN